MRRMLRQALNLLTAASLALFLGAILLWIGSAPRAKVYRVSAFAEYYDPCPSLTGAYSLSATSTDPAQKFVSIEQSLFSLEDSPRAASFFSSRVIDFVPPHTTKPRLIHVLQTVHIPSADQEVKEVFQTATTAAKGVPGGTRIIVLAFPGFRYLRVSGGSERGVYVAYWLLLATFGLLPLIRFVRWINPRPTRQRGHCRACGYDLRATPARCPECGARPRPE